MARRSFSGIVVLGLLCAGAGHAAETLSSYSMNGSTHPDSESTAAPVSVKCTAASGASSGSTAQCHIRAPGYQGTLAVGQSIATSAAGLVELSCSGSYPARGMLSCSAVIDTLKCVRRQNLSAYSSQGNTYGENAPMVTAAAVRCTQATGAIRGSTALCGVKAPGFLGSLAVGQSRAVTGPGTVQLTCAGTYPAGGTLSCNAEVVQSCP